jgi:DNA-binding response OmpR family regulator
MRSGMKCPAGICLNMNMPGLSGIETLERIREHNPLTGGDSVATAVRAMKLGAHDYLTKPLNQTKFVNALQLLRPCGYRQPFS